MPRSDRRPIAAKAVPKSNIKVAALMLLVITAVAALGVADALGHTASIGLSQAIGQAIGPWGAEVE